MPALLWIQQSSRHLHLLRDGQRNLHLHCSLWSCSDLFPLFSNHKSKPATVAWIGTTWPRDGFRFDKTARSTLPTSPGCPAHRNTLPHPIPPSLLPFPHPEKPVCWPNSASAQVAYMCLSSVQQGWYSACISPAPLELTWMCFTARSWKHKDNASSLCGPQGAFRLCPDCFTNSLYSLLFPSHLRNKLFHFMILFT